MDEEYYEVPSEEYEEDITAGDITLIVGGIVLVCLVLALVMTLIKRTFRNFHLKIGDKVEIGMETKE